MGGYSLLQMWLVGIFGLFLGVPIGMLTVGLCQMVSRRNRFFEEKRREMKSRLHGNWEEV